MTALIILGLSAALALSFTLFFSGSRKKWLMPFLKAAALFYFLVAFFRYMLADSFIYVINRGIFDSTYYELTDLTQSILRWGQYLSYVVLVMAAFFNSRLFKNIALYVCLPFSIATVFYFDDFIFTYFMDSRGRGIQAGLGFRQFYFGLELVLAITIPLIFACNGHCFRLRDRHEWRDFLCALPFVIIGLVPVYIPQSIIGHTSIKVSALSVANIVWLFLTFLEVSVLYVIFRFKSYRHRYMLCMFLSLALFMHYSGNNLMGLNLKRLPFQLCNMGVYFFVVALLIKKTAFFNFAFLANIMGTLLAMLLPDMENAGFGFFWNYHYIVEHMQVLVIPLLCMLLRLFPRLKPQAIKHLAIGFSCYFVFCWLIGVGLNGTQDLHNRGPVNFFYIFNLDLAVDKIPHLGFMRSFNVVIFSRFEFNPVFQLTVYTIFLLMCMGLYWVVMGFYDLLDDSFRLRRARIDLWEKITGKPTKLKREYDED